MKSITGALSRPLAIAALLAVVASNVAAQADTPPAGADTTDRPPTPLAAVTVTATRTLTQTFSVPQPVAVIESRAARERLASTHVDLFRILPGLDVTGAGSNQTRPMIRGHRGQRILLLEDGLRLNNSRRQQDFGELPVLSGFNGIDRVEIVRGPSSVLYGTDAIGGVVNVIPADLPSIDAGSHVGGFLEYRYGRAGDQHMPGAGVHGRFGRFAFRASGGRRDAEPYTAPAGTFGGITLTEPARVEGTGIHDRSYNLTAGWDATDRQRLFVRTGRYSARDAAFGYIDPALLGPNQPLIDIGYPQQAYYRHSIGYRAHTLRSPLADRFELTAYTQRNERDFTLRVLVPLTPVAQLDSRSLNYTNLHTVGFRAEAAKLLLGRHMLTYGLDYYRDRSRNTDSSITVITGFGPPITSVSRMPLVPNATLSSAGAFAQGDVHFSDRLSTVIGARLQGITAETRDTPGLATASLTSRDGTAVGTANVIYRATEHLNLITSLGRGFRSPNLVERFFDGPAPEGSGFQRANPDLEPETSINLDAGFRYRRGVFFAELFGFSNRIRNGIRIEATGDSVNRQPAFRNVNVDRLRHSGIEAVAGVRLLRHFDLTTSYTKLESRNLSDPNSPVGDTYGSKLVGDVAYRTSGSRALVGYTIRHNGEQRDAIVGTNPIGSALPAFTVHSARAQLVVLERGGTRHSVGVNVENLTDELYAESSNASFFRPEPRRSVRLGWFTQF